MNIESVMQTELISVYENESMALGIKRIRENKIKHLPVLNEEGKLVGIVTDRDLKRASASDATALEIHELLYLLDKVKMKDVMTRDVVTAARDTPIPKVAGLMADRAVGCLPIIQDDIMVGLVTRTDILNFVANQG